MLQIHNTLTRDKEILKTIRPNKIGIYACGVTVYDYCHLGHARTYVSIDMIVRYLRARGYDVNFIRNITDIDDKIIKRANEASVDYTEITKQFTEAMHEDFKALELLEPNKEPRATDYIAKMIQLIQKIIDNGHAYVGKSGDVYFDVRHFPLYGELSHHDIEQLESGARVQVAEEKRDPLDFVLWKSAKAGEPAWDSPWGSGRPGWHLECSAMSMDLLGEHFDIHAGGRDLIFPHHENEIAQSKAGTNKPFVNIWMHTGFLQIEKEKMSKSLGNFITIRDVLKNHSAEVLRFFLLSSHYRSPIVYADDMLNQAKQSLTRFYTALRHLNETPAIEHTKYEANFYDAMDDDFNTPIALSHLFELAHEIQRLRDNDLNSASAHGALLKKLGGVLGILQKDPEMFFQSSVVDQEKILTLIAERKRAREDKNWAEADRIRDVLTNMSIAIEDGPNGTTWKSLK